MENEYEIGLAQGPDGELWIKRGDLIAYLTTSADFIADNPELEASARGMTAAFLRGMATSFASGVFEPATPPTD